jgi:Family of unknown function (DUF6164)
MAALLFKLNNVPDDEAEDIRTLLSENDIHFYETHAGFFRMGLDAIWLHDKSQYETAKNLIHEYQIQRTEQQQKNYAELLEQGEVVGFWRNIVLHPIRFFAALIAIAFVLVLTLVPFLFL